MDFETRLAALERSARRWRAAAVGLAGVVMVVAFVGAGGDPAPVDAKFGTVTCKILKIEDDAGNNVAGLGYDGTGFCQKFYVVTKDKRELCKIVALPEPDDTEKTGVMYLYGPTGTVSVAPGGKELISLRKNSP